MSMLPRRLNASHGLLYLGSDSIDGGTEGFLSRPKWGRFHNVFFVRRPHVFFRVLEHVLAKFWGAGEVLVPIGSMEIVCLPAFT